MTQAVKLQSLLWSMNRSSMKVSQIKAQHTKVRDGIKNRVEFINQVHRFNSELFIANDVFHYTAITRAFYEDNNDMIELFNNFTLFRSSENHHDMNQQLFWNC